MQPIINAETVTAIQTALQPVADKIGQGAEYVWTTVVMQQYVVGISYLIWTGALACATVAALFFTRHAIRQVKQDEYDEGWTVGCIFGGIACLTLPVVAIICLTQGVMHVINPGYYALEFFITLGRSATGQ